MAKFIRLKFSLLEWFVMSFLGLLEDDEFVLVVELIIEGARLPSKGVEAFPKGVTGVVVKGGECVVASKGGGELCERCIITL